MPFTLAHPAAALPLRRLLGRYACTSALAIGAMAPDLGYFLPLGVGGKESHSLGGLVWFCLPVGLAVWMVFVHMVAPMARAVAPEAIRSRLRDSSHAGRLPRGLMAAGVSLLVGALTHLAWDSFTHSTGVAVQALPALQASVPLLAGYSPQVCTLLQYGSSLLGLVVLTGMVVRWHVRTPAVPLPYRSRAPLWLRALIVLAVLGPSLAAAIRVIAPDLADGLGSFAATRQTVVRTIFATGTVFLAALAATSVAWRLAGTWWTRLRSE